MATVAEISRGMRTCLPYRARCHRQHLALQRVMDGLVTPFDLVPFQVDEHVGQAGDGPHEQRGQAANDPQGRQRPAGHPTHDENRRRSPGTAATKPTRADAPRAGSPAGCPLSRSGRGPARPSRSARSGKVCRLPPPSTSALPAADTTFEFARVWRTRRLIHERSLARLSGIPASDASYVLMSQSGGIRVSDARVR